MTANGFDYRGLSSCQSATPTELETQFGLYRVRKMQGKAGHIEKQKNKNK